MLRKGSNFETPSFYSGQFFSFSLSLPSDHSEGRSTRLLLCLCLFLRED